MADIDILNQLNKYFLPLSINISPSLLINTTQRLPQNLGPLVKKKSFQISNGLPLFQAT